MNDPEHVKRLSQERFGKFAQDYVTSQTHASRNELDILASFAKAEPHWRILDIATGGGHTSLHFSSLVNQVVAVDLTEKMLKAARNFHRSKGVSNLSYAAADAENLPFPAQSFDLVTCRIAAHHFPHVQSFVDEGARVLRQGGKFVFQDQVVPDDPHAGDYVNNFERRRDPSHHIAYDQQGWLRFFENARLKITNSQIIGKTHNFLNWAQMQNCSSETIAQLVELALHSPRIAYEWLAPENFSDINEATFRNQHLILVASKDW